MKEREDEKKKRQQQATTEAKALAVLDAKARCLEENDYRGKSVQDLTTLLAWYNIPKEKMKKSDMIARWKEIRRNHVPPPIFEKWGDSDEEELVRLKSTEVDMSETALGRYAALMKRQAFASVLDFTDKEWTNLKKLREEVSTAMATTSEATADEMQMDAQAGEGQYNDLG